MRYSYQQTCLVEDAQILEQGQQLMPEIERIRAAMAEAYETDYASINAPADQQMLSEIKTAVTQKRLLKPAALVVVGIGGSNLGTRAVHEALRGKLYNETSGMKVYYADTVDADYIADIVERVEALLNKGENIIVNVVSKSGGTTETIANFHVFVNLLKRHKSDYQKYIVVTTDHGSKLWEAGQQDNYTCLAIAEKVGGRYSVFSPVGLFPLGLIGIDIYALVCGAQSMLLPCTDTSIMQNPAAIRAIILAEQYQQNKIVVHDLFTFSVDLQSVGAWYRQLMGESIGKAQDIHGNRVEVGIIPTVSVGSTDLHSVAQLYLGGPRNVFTTFLTVAKNNRQCTVKPIEQYQDLVAKIQGKSLSSIMHAIVSGVQTAYQKEQRPFVTIELPQKTEEHIGKLLQLFMIEIMYLGYLLEVNPFDQPQVELYKKETREILAHE